MSEYQVYVFNPKRALLDWEMNLMTAINYKKDRQHLCYVSVTLSALNHVPVDTSSGQV